MLAMKPQYAGIQLMVSKLLILIHGISFLYTITKCPASLSKIELLHLQSHFNQFLSTILLKTLIFTNVRKKFGESSFAHAILLQMSSYSLPSAELTF